MPVIETAALLRPQSLLLLLLKYKPYKNAQRLVLLPRIKQEKQRCAVSVPDTLIILYLKSFHAYLVMKKSMPCPFHLCLVSLHHTFRERCNAYVLLQLCHAYEPTWTSPTKGRQTPSSSKKPISSTFSILCTLLKTHTQIFPSKKKRCISPPSSPPSSYPLSPPSSPIQSHPLTKPTLYQSAVYLVKNAETASVRLSLLRIGPSRAPRMIDQW